MMMDEIADEKLQDNKVLDSISNVGKYQNEQDEHNNEIHEIAKDINVVDGMNEFQNENEQNKKENNEKEKENQKEEKEQNEMKNLENNSDNDYNKKLITVKMKDNINNHNQKSRRQFTLPIRSMTLGSSSSSSKFEMNENDNNDSNGKMIAISSNSSHQLIQSYSLEVVASTSSSSPPTSTSSAGIPTTRIHITNSNDDNNCNSNSQKFKTKRFYETDDDNTLMTQIFSQTIRSTSVTPTDECDMTDFLQDIAKREQQQQQQQTNTESSASSPTTATPTIVATAAVTTAVSTNNYDQKSIPSIKTTPSPPPLISSPTFSSMNYLVNDNTDNYSTTEYSNAESQTDNIEMYNEPNMSSLLDNLQSDCEEFIDKSDTEDIGDPDYNPWDIKPKTTTTTTTTTTTIITNDQHNNTINGSSSSNSNINMTIITTTNSSTNTVNNLKQQQSSLLPTSTLTTSSSSTSLSAAAAIKMTSDNNQGPIKRRPSIVVEFYNDDLTKNLEYEVEGGEIENYQCNAPTTPTTPNIPIVSIPAAMAAAKFSYFDTTIEEEDDDISEFQNHNNHHHNNNNNNNNNNNCNADQIISNNDDNIDSSNKRQHQKQPDNNDNNYELDKTNDTTDKSLNDINQCDTIIENDERNNTDILSHQNLNENHKNLSSTTTSPSSSSAATLNNDDNNMIIIDNNDQIDSTINMHESINFTNMENQSITSATAAVTSKKSVTRKISSSTRTLSSSSTTTTSTATTHVTKDLQEVTTNGCNKNSSILIDNAQSAISTKLTGDQNAVDSTSSSSDLQQIVKEQKSQNMTATTTIEKIATKKKSDSTNVEGSKKKSKKSKKSDAEKENISVNGKENYTKINNKEIRKIIPSNMRLHDDDLSNIDVKSLKKIYLLEQPPVNRKFKENNNKQFQIPLNRSVSVKQLCRSFGDLTAIKAYASNDNLKRAKSVSDVRSIEIGISVKQLKSSFSKFDALQKKNILHVRSSDAGKAQEKFNDVNSEIEKNCRSCGKIVYKMEEIKAEKSIWHRNCFKCNECGKQLNVDTYQSHESVLYCKPHFKLLFAPKAVENNEPVRPKKPEMIIRENQPVELPADVVRASDKPDLGLDELHQLDVKSRFQVFEHLQDQQTTSEQNASIERSPSGVTRSASILSKLAKFEAKGMDTGVTDDVLSGIPLEQSSSDDENDDDEIDENDPDAALIRSKRIQKERPMSFSNMNDIKSKFEKGHVMTREEKREERKQEIQNIRSRLFMGKQAKIKEMYQQAVADSEHAITSSGKKPEIDIGDKAKSLKEKFEKGEIFNKEDDEIGESNHKVQDEDMAVFEQGISKKSRSIFMELDASASKPPQLTPQPTTPRSADANKQKQPFSTDNVVKYDEKPDDIKIETSEISSKFKFFETYKPTEQRKKEFRITPPREGVVKMPSPERDNEQYIDADVVRSDDRIDDPSVVAKTQTATKMLSIFRQMEQNKYQDKNEEGLKPLKQFTPPPNDNRRLYDNNRSDEEYSDSEEEEEGGEEEEEEQEESDNEKQNNRYEDEYLKQAKLEARAKQLRAKFEKWEANEIRREMSNGTINVYENADNESQIESAKTLRAKFESMREQNDTSPNRPKIKVNRFV